MAAHCRNDRLARLLSYEYRRLSGSITQFMPESISPTARRSLLVNNTPLIDVRAPIEFARGSIPSAVNLPLLDDAQREAVGKRYRQAGQDAAVRLGHELISGALRDSRLAQWSEFVEAHGDAAIFCYRGGLRSATVQQWLKELGLHVPRIAGGYKALRSFLVNTLAEVADTTPLLLVAGKTGCAKTDLVNRLSPAVDLEGLANHRGSAFGRRVSPQPAQADFENALAVALLRLPWEETERLVLEDEGRAIGSLSVPMALFRRMQQAPIAIIEKALPARVDTVLHAYVKGNYSDYHATAGIRAEQEFSNYLHDSLKRIQKRLGVDLFREIRSDLDNALHSHLQGQGIDAHKIWIEKLLRLYYDPMYEYQLEKKLHRIVFRGNSEEFLHWISGLRLVRAGAA